MAAYRLAALVAAEYVDEEEFPVPEEVGSDPELLLRLAASYEFEIDRFTIEPALAVDFGGEVDTLFLFGVAFGYNF